MLPQTKLTIRGIRGRAVDVPMKRPLETRGGLLKSAPLVLIDLETHQGITGSSYVFCFIPLALKPVLQLVSGLEQILRGDTVAPFTVEQKLQGTFRLLGSPGLVRMALAGIDIAAWDAIAKACGMPLVRALGGEPRPIQAYNGCGLGLIGAERVAAEAQDLIAPGFKALKVRLGYTDLATDVAVVRSIEASVGEDTLLMADYNQCLSVPEALKRINTLDKEELVWIEEPTLADDYYGHAAITRAAKTPIQIGENWWGPRDMCKAVAVGASDFAMLDLVKIGGVTGWLRAATLAEVHGLPVSSHLFPEVSAHLLAITSTCHWLEYVDWANPILYEPLTVESGHALLTEAPGVGICWDEEAIQHFLVE